MKSIYIYEGHIIIRKKKRMDGLDSLQYWYKPFSRDQAGRQGSQQIVSGGFPFPHHVKVSLTISMTTSLIKRVTLKRSLTHSAYVMLRVEEGRWPGPLDVKRQKK